MMGIYSTKHEKSDLD